MLSTIPIIKTPLQYISRVDCPHAIFKSLGNEVHIWSVNLTNFNMPSNEIKQLLPTTERARAQRFRSKTARIRYIKSQIMLRLLLGKYLGIDYYKQEFDWNPYGKPALKQLGKEESLYFNLSDTDNVCVCAFAHKGNVGVDVEKIHEIPEINDIVARIFSPAEKNMFYQLPGNKRKESFFKCWTRKEALLKTMGVGLSLPLEKVDVISDQEEISRVIFKTKELDAENEWIIQDINIFEGFASAIAFKNKPYDRTTQIHHFHLAV